MPISLTTVTQQTLRDTDASIVSDLFAPNVYFTEFTARKLSNPRFRGIGSSPANPAVATYFDGVPQLNTNSSSIDLIDVGQVEFVRGPQSALFGRNSIGGLINVTSAGRRSRAGRAACRCRSRTSSSREVRGNVAGPVVDGKVGVSAALQYGQRDGFTVNDLTGNDIDSREAFSAKGQVLWTPESHLGDPGHRQRRARARRRLRAERPGRSARQPVPRDARLRGAHRSRHLRHDHPEPARRHARQPVVHDRLPELEDRGCHRSRLHAAAADRAATTTRRASSSRRKCASRRRRTRRFACRTPRSLKWQAGVFLFTQNYEQDAVNYAGAVHVLRRSIPFPVAQHIAAVPSWTTSASACMGRARRRSANRFDLTAGVRVDHEQKDAVAEHVLHAAVRPPPTTSTPKRASRTSRRSSRRRSGCSRRRRCTSPSRAATRRAGSIRSRRSAARRTVKSTRGISRAASRRCGPAGGCWPTRACSASTGKTCS